VLLAIGCYLSKKLQIILMHDIPHIAFPILIVSFLGMRFAIQRLDNGIRRRELEKSGIAQKIIDTERMLVEQMDPVLLNQLKTIVRREIE